VLFYIFRVIREQLSRERKKKVTFKVETIDLEALKNAKEKNNANDKKDDKKVDKKVEEARKDEKSASTKSDSSSSPSKVSLKKGGSLIGGQRESVVSLFSPNVNQNSRKSKVVIEKEKILSLPQLGLNEEKKISSFSPDVRKKGRRLSNEKMDRLSLKK